MTDYTWRLPEELWMQVFVYCQPAQAAVDLKALWRNPWKHPSVQAELGHGLVVKGNGSKYHGSVVLSRGGVPVLLVLSQACRRFRAILLAHPFYAMPRHHLLLPLDASSFKCLKAPLTDHFIPRHTTSWILDLSNFPYLYPKAGDFRRMASKISHPHALQTLVICTGWRTLGSHWLRELIAQLFPNLQRLYLKGLPEKGVLHGFDNKAVKILTRNLVRLTHLYLDGFISPAGFDFRHLCALLRRNPSITCLLLG